MPVEAGPGAVIVDKNSVPDRSREPRRSGSVNMPFMLSADGPAGKAGERIMLSVTPAEVSNQNEELDSWLGGYSQFGFVADMLAPVVLVDQEKAQRRSFKAENVFERVPTKTGRHGAIHEIKHMSDTEPYETEEYALAAFVPFAAETDAVKNYNVKQAHMQMIPEKLALDRECRVFELLTDLNSWDAANRTSLGASLKWNTGASKNPLLDLHTRIKASVQKVTGILVNEDVLFWFLADTAVQARMRQMYGDNAPSPDLAMAAESQGVMTFQFLGLPPITVCPAKQMVAGSLVSIVPNDVILVSQPAGLPNDGTRMATCMTFRTKGRSGTGWTTNEYIPQSGRGLESGTMMESGYKEDVFMASGRCGGLIKDVL